MNPKAKPLLLVIALTVLVVTALRGHKKSVNNSPVSYPNITVMINFNALGE